MRPLIRALTILGCFALALAAPREASAITVDQIVSLAKSGVTDTVILALIDRDRTIFAIEPEQIVTLQRDGVSEPVILAMLKSGREEGDQQARAEAAYNYGWIMSNLPTEPLSISVGHRPELPYPYGDYRPTTPSAAFAPYYGPTFRSRKAQPLPARRTGEPRALCYAQISTQRVTNAGAFVTECPEIMQPARR